MTHSAFVGIGANLGDAIASVRAGMRALKRVGRVRHSSSLYRTVPWGLRDQPHFINAVVEVETELDPPALLAALKALERDLGRQPGPRWGARIIDLDILLYDDLEMDQPDLTIPHARLHERAFALVPLAEIDERYAPWRDRLSAIELAGVERLPRETVALMSDEHNSLSLAERVRRLAGVFDETGLVRLRIERDGEEIELGRRTLPAALAEALSTEAGEGIESQALRLDVIKADLVGIFHLSRPAPAEGDLLEADRELAYIEALGIRNPVRSLGGGRIVSIKRTDGDAVEYGQPLFEIDRG